MTRIAGSTNNSEYFRIVQDNSASNPGEPVTGLLYSDIETGGSASYARQGAARVDLTLITLASAGATHSDGGFILVDDTNMPGVYRCDYPDAAYVTGVQQVVFSLTVASAKNAIVIPISHDLIDFDTSTSTPTVNTTKISGTTQTAGDVTGLVTTVDTAVDANQTDLNTLISDVAAVKAETVLILADTTEVVTGACTATLTGATTFDTDLTPALNQFQNMFIRFDSDTTTTALRNQTAKIESITTGGEITLTSALTVSTANTDSFQIF